MNTSPNIIAHASIPVLSMTSEDVIAYAQSMQAPKRTNTPNLQTYNIIDSNAKDTKLYHASTYYTIPTNTLSDIHTILAIVHPNTPYRLAYGILVTAFNINTWVYNNQQTPNLFQAQMSNTTTQGRYFINMHAIPPLSCTDLSIADARHQMNTRIKHHFNNIFSQNPTKHIIRTNHRIRATTEEIPHHLDIKFVADIGAHHANHQLTIGISIHYQQKNTFYTDFTISPNNINDIDALYDQTIPQLLAHIQDNPNIYTHKQSQHYYISLIRAMHPYLTRKDSPLRQHIHHCVQEILQHYVYLPPANHKITP